MIALTVAELATNFYDLVAGIIIHTVIFLALIIHASFTATNESPTSRLILSLSLVPLVRMLSLFMPFTSFAPVFWYIIIYPPLLIASFVAMRRMDYSLKRIGFMIGNLRIQLLIALSGVILGVTEYYILQPPEPLVPELTLGGVLLSIIALGGGTGLVEEFVFRGILQQTSKEVLGRGWLVYVAYLFAILHVIHYSILDIFFVFAVGVYFGWIVNKTGSLFGVILAHSLTNIMLFLVLPSIN